MGLIFKEGEISNTFFGGNATGVSPAGAATVVFLPAAVGAVSGMGISLSLNSHGPGMGITVLILVPFLLTAMPNISAIMECPKGFLKSYGIGLTAGFALMAANSDAAEFTPLQEPQAIVQVVEVKPQVLPTSLPAMRLESL